MLDPEPPATEPAPALADINDDHSSDSGQRADRQHVGELLRSLPALDRTFSLHRKIGEGAFSSVWLGSLKREKHLRDSERRWYAIKHLLPTAHPSRVEQELRCLRDMGGRDNIIAVELCLRQLDTVVFVMPYIPHARFSEYARHMEGAETRRYMRALLQALRAVHRRGVIHRDVKPSNFLYDRTHRRYMLVDFGLAQRVAHITHKYSRKRPAQTESWCAPRAKRVATGAAPLQPLQLDHPRLAQRQPGATADEPRTPAPASKVSVVEGTAGGARCGCAGRGAVCARCLARPAARAPRAGTQGFRPPEVLLKYQHQTTAVDVWASGVMLLSVLSGRYPFFRATDDAAALAEFASLFGTTALQRAAAALGRELVCSERRRAVCVRELCARLRGSDASTTDQPRTPEAEWCGFPDSAFDLLLRLLELDPRARITADAALQHPFFADP